MTDSTDWAIWRGILYGLAITAGAVLAGAGVAGVFSGCTVERVVLYETVNYPLAAVSPSGAIYPKARTP